MQCNRVSVLAILVLAAGLMLSSDPALAKAKAGSSSGAGSRGSKTYDSIAPAPSQTAPTSGFLQHNSSGSSNSAAQPITRSTTPPAAKAAPAGPAVQSETLAPPSMAAPREQVSPTATQSMGGQAMPAARPSFFTGFMGGLVGAGIGSMLFGGGHGFFGEGSGGFFGAALQLLILFLVGRWLFKTFLGARIAPAPRPTAYRRMDFGSDDAEFAPRGQSEPRLEAGAPVLAAPAATLIAANPRQFLLNEQDLGAIEGLLVQVQAAWSAGDRASLQRLATPEMAGYFNEQLTEDRNRGLENRVEQVQLLRGDVNETWHEGPVDYATVTLTWTAVDYTLQLPAGEVVAGDPRHAAESTEVWTLLRSPGAPWILSAIQQV